MAAKMIANSMFALSMVVFAGIASPVSSISCQDTLSKLFPCQPFLTGSGEITGYCCDGIQTLKRIAVSNSDGKTICQCVKQALISIGIRNPIIQKAVLLPQLCKISLPFDINSTTDCQSEKIAYEDMQINADKGKCTGVSQNACPSNRKLD